MFVSDANLKVETNFAWIWWLTHSDAHAIKIVELPFIQTLTFKSTEHYLCLNVKAFRNSLKSSLHREALIFLITMKFGLTQTSIPSCVRKLINQINVLLLAKVEHINGPMIIYQTLKIVLHVV